MDKNNFNKMLKDIIELKESLYQGIIPFSKITPEYLEESDNNPLVYNDERPINIGDINCKAYEIVSFFIVDKEFGHHDIVSTYSSYDSSRRFYLVINQKTKEHWIELLDMDWEVKDYAAHRFGTRPKLKPVYTIKIGKNGIEIAEKS